MAVVSKGFTLLELLVTISIIGILLGIGSVSFSTAQKRGRDSRRKSDMKAIQLALEQCYAVDNKYPDSVSSTGGALTCTSGDIVMNQVPFDPKNSGNYIYNYAPNNAIDKTKYCLCALLEDTTGGNASQLGSGGGACTFATSGTYYCVSNRQ